jgi:DNA repair exonuclease SbcCD nuclease subunit
MRKLNDYSKEQIKKSVLGQNEISETSIIEAIKENENFWTYAENENEAEEMMKERFETETEFSEFVEKYGFNSRVNQSFRLSFDEKSFDITVYEYYIDSGVPANDYIYSILCTEIY